MPRLLLGQCFKNQMSFSSDAFRDPMDFRDYLLDTYPEMISWAKREIFERIEPWPESTKVSVTSKSKNIAGRFMAANLMTPAEVIDDPLTPEILEKELANGEYTHVGIGVFVDSFSDFIQCCATIRRFDNNIKIIAGNVGALFEEVARYADYVCQGEGIAFLRRLFGEPLDAPIQPVLVPEDTYIQYRGKKVDRPWVKLVTKLGCPMKCDFCPTNRYFKGYYSGELFSPAQIHEFLVNYHNQIGRDFSIIFAEPTAIISRKWWYELFNLFREETEDYPVIMATTAASLRGLNFDRINNSALRFDTVNICVERFDRKYSKNSHIDMKNLITQLRNIGIGTYLSYIVGFDTDTWENVIQQTHQITSLDALVSSVFNLHPLPTTPVWEKLKEQNRLLFLPIDFFYILGFQPFLHPHLKPGFEDMLPLLSEVYKIIEKESSFLPNYCQVTSNLISAREQPLPQHYSLRRSYKLLSNLMYSSWKKFFKPSKVEQIRYETAVHMKFSDKILSRIINIFV